MSKSAYAGGTRRKNARETYLDQISNGRGLTTYGDKKRKPFTRLRSFDDTDLAYRSTSSFLRQAQEERSSIEPMEMILARSIPRTKSASEMTPRSTHNRSSAGNPMYKAQEDYYDEVQGLKKDMKALREENSTLRSKNRRLEEEIVRKKKEIDGLGDPTKDNDLRRALTGSSTDRNNVNQTQTANVIISLKQRIFKLQSQLKEKENRIEEMESDPRWTRSTELEYRNRALENEVERMKLDRRNLIQNDYSAALDEEKKQAVVKLEAERKQLMKENESLRKKLEELEKTGPESNRSARKTDQPSSEEVERLNRRIENLQDRLEKVQRESDENRQRVVELKETLRETEKERDNYQRRLNDLQQELDDVKREKDRPVRRSPIPMPDRQEREPSPVLSRLNFKPIPSPGTGKMTKSPNTSILSTGRRTPSSPPLSSPKASVRNLRGQTPDRDDMEEKVNDIKKKRAARVIQREWRKYHEKKPKASIRDSDRLRKDDTERDVHTPAAQRRPSSDMASQDSALRTVQATLRGLLNRSNLNKTPVPSSSPTTISSNRSRMPTFRDRTPQKDDDDDDVTPKTKRFDQPVSEKRSEWESPRSSKIKPGLQTPVPRIDPHVMEQIKTVSKGHDRRGASSPLLDPRYSKRLLSTNDYSKSDITPQKSDVDRRISRSDQRSDVHPPTDDDDVVMS